MKRSEIRGGIDASRQSRITLRSIRATRLTAAWSLRGHRHLLGKAQERAADRAVADAAIGFEQLHRARGAQPFEGVGACPALAAIRPEQRRDWHLENLGDALQAPGADTVRTVFVFLNLLESDAQPFAHVFCDMRRDRRSVRTRSPTSRS
jgi:hypothetical protein